VECCPAGHEPLHSEYDAASATTTTTMPAATCAGCPFRKECLIEEKRDGFQLKYSDAGVSGTLPPAVGDRVDEQRPETPAGYGGVTGAG
jgi:hypothetical protein